MTPKIKNIIIFLGIGVVLILLYVFLIKGSPDQASLTSTSNDVVIPASGVPDENSLIAQDFLTLLLSVKSISLQDSIFKDPAFISLQDSSIELVQDHTEGRPNPFAPIGSDIIVTPATPSSNPSVNTVTGATPYTDGATTPAKTTTPTKTTTPAKTPTN